TLKGCTHSARPRVSASQNQRGVLSGRKRPTMNAPPPLVGDPAERSDAAPRGAKAQLSGRPARAGRARPPAELAVRSEDYFLLDIFGERGRKSRAQSIYL